MRGTPLGVCAVAAMAALSCWAIHGLPHQMTRRLPVSSPTTACVARIRPPRPQAHLVRLPEHGLDGLLLSHAQFRDGAPFPAVHVPGGEEVEEVAGGGFAGVGEHAPLDEHPLDGGGLRPVDGPQRAQGHVERVTGRRGRGRLRRRSGALAGA